jgi:hypothetical protein
MGLNLYRYNVVSANPEAKSPGAALKEDMDSYYLTPCNAKSGKW